MEVFPYSIALELTAVLILWIGLSIWQRDRRAPGGRWFAAVIASVLVWTLGELFFVRGLLDPWQHAVVTYAGVMSVGPFFVGTAAHAAAVPLARRMPWFPLALWVPGLFVYAFLFLGPWSGLFLAFHGSEVVRGPLFWVYNIYAYLMVSAAMALFVLATLRWPRQGLLRRVVALALAILIPLAGNVVYVHFDGVLPFDPTPVLISGAAVALRAAVFRGGLLDVLPIGDQSLVEHLPVGLVLADDLGAVIEANPAALDWLGMSREQALGRSLQALLATLPPGVAAHSTEFSLDRRHMVHCAVLTEEHAAPVMRTIALS
jgi:PAS domain-containing protein